MEITIQQAVTAHQEGKLDEAEGLYLSLLKIDPKDLDAHNNLGVLFNSLGRLDEAEISYRKAIKLKPDYAEAHCNLGITINTLKRFDEAEASFNKAIELKPSYVEAHNNLGATQQILRRYDEAVASFNKAIEFKADYAEAHNNLGATQRILKRYDEAVASFNKAIELKPSYVEAHNNLGVTQQLLRRYDEAEASFNKALEFKPDYLRALNNLGALLVAVGRLNEAEVIYKKALNHNPNFAVVHSNLGIALQALGKLDEAAASFNKAIELSPDYAHAYCSLGSLQKNTNKPDEAVASFNKAIELKPDLTEALLSRGDTLFAKGQYQLALKDFDTCNTLDSKVRSLYTLHALGKIEDVYQRIEDQSEVDDVNLRVAAFSAFISYKEKKDTDHKFCNNPMDFIYISNLLSHIEKPNLFVNEVIEELHNVDTFWQPFSKSTKKGFQSLGDLFKNPSEKINDLKSIIINEVDAYHSKFKGEDCSFIKKWPSKKKIQGWHVILKKQGYQNAHVHPGGWLSGVVYLKVVPPREKNEGAIEFCLNGEQYFDDDSPKLIHNPNVGDIVLFPSSLHHRTIPFTTDEDRIIISFDLIPF